MIRKATLQIGIPTLLACMTLNAYFAVHHLRSMQKSAALTVASHTLQASISRALQDLTDMETDQRGYLLTADQSYLQVYSEAKDKIGSDFATLRERLASQSADERSLESKLEWLGKSKQVEMERTIDLRQRGYRHRAFVLVDTNEGKAYMDEARRIVSSLSSLESRKVAALDTEQSSAMRRMLSLTIMANLCLLLLAACLFAVFRHHERLLAEESAQFRQDLRLRDIQLARLTSALSGEARFNITALNTTSRLLLENYGGFLPRQGHEYAEQMKEAATQIEQLRQHLVGDSVTAA